MKKTFKDFFKEQATNKPASKLKLDYDFNMPKVKTLKKSDYFAKPEPRRAGLASSQVYYPPGTKPKHLTPPPPTSVLQKTHAGLAAAGLSSGIAEPIGVAADTIDTGLYGAEAIAHLIAGNRKKAALKAGLAGVSAGSVIPGVGIKPGLGKLSYTAGQEGLEALLDK